MIGNDVVDLHDPEARPCATHPRFDARVFADCERFAIAAGDDPNRLRWRLWAAKEAAYKVARKLDRRAVFSPVRFVVAGSVVMHEGRAFALSFEDGEEYVHAVVRSGPAGATWSGVQAVADASSLVVRGAAITAAAAILGENERDLSIATRDRIPRLEVRGHAAPLDLSLSHHGRFVAWALSEEVARRPLRSGAHESLSRGERVRVRG